jgi:predicted permease
VAERPSPAIRVLFRIAGLVASEEELGDVMEDYVARRHGALWVCRQLLSTTGRRWSRAAVSEGRPAMISHVWADVSYAMRTFRRYPGFAAAAIAPIALGIGINTGLFSILDAIALQPVASPRPAELVSIYQDFRGVKKRRVHGARAMFSLPEFEQYRAAARTLTGVMAYSRYSAVTLGGDAPRQIGGAFVTCNYFDVLQVRPSIGAGFTDANCERAAASPSVVLTHELWTQLYGAEREIAGKTIVLNGRIFAIAGVAPPGFTGIDFTRVSFFAPVSAQPLLQPGENYFRDPVTSWLTMVARRRPGVTLDEARAELAVVARQIDLEQPERTTTLIVAPARALSNPGARREIFNVATVLLAAFGLILLIACANVANLLLARGAARGKEIAVRLSLGITRARLVQQLLTESMIIAFAGAAAGTVLAQWSFRSLFALLRSVFPDQMPALAIEPGLNANVLSFALIVTVATGFVFGLLPALQASRLDLQTLLNRDSAGAGRRRGGWLRGSLVGLQAAVCTTLLISAALLLRAVYVTGTIEPGFAYRSITVVSFDLRGPGYDGPRAAAFRQRLTDRLRSLPGVEGVAEAGRTPLSPGRSQTAVRRADQKEWQEIDFTNVSPEYFSVVGIPIVRGRTFSADELADRSKAAILTESTARRYFPDDEPVGQRLLMALGPDAEASLEIVGVARDAQVTGIGETGASYMYLPAERSSSQGFDVLVKSPAPLAALVPAIRGAARELEPALVVSVAPLEDNLRFWRSVSRLTAGVSGSLSALALLLASIGIYGVVSYVVSRRIREMGIRMMLGASAADVRRMILAQTLRPVAIGLALGIAGAAAASQILQSVLFGVSRFDPVAFVAAPLLLIGVAAAAIVAPTWQALARDPMTSLRRE